MNRYGAFVFTRGVDAFLVYVGAWVLGCFYSLISAAQTFWRALTTPVDSCAEIKTECPFSGVTNSGRVWRRKVPESDARSQTPSTGLRHPSFGGRCRKAVLGVWGWLKLQALLYDIFPSTTAVFSYAIGLRKLSANEQFFVGAQTVVIKFVTDYSNYIRRLFYNYVAYASSNKTKIV